MANAFQAAAPWVLRLAINGLSEEIEAIQLWRYGGLILLIAIGSGTFRFLMRRTLIAVSRYIEYDLRQTIFRHLEKLEPAFYDHSRIGDLMARCTSDVEQVRMVLGPALMYTMNTVFGLIFGVSLMLAISVKLTLMVLIIFPVVSITVYHLGKRVHAASTASQEKLSDLTSITQESFSGIRVIKAFHQQKDQIERFTRISREYLSKNLNLVFQQAVFIPAIMLLFGIGIGAILLYGGKQIIDGEMKIGDFVAFTSYLMILTWPMISVGWVVSLFQRGNASLTRIDTILQRKPAITDSTGKTSDEMIRGHIRFHKVSFTYPKSEQEVLKNISFDIKPGQKTGIVGRVGSGKSTVISLISRLYDGYEGEITLDDQPISSYSLHLLHSAIGIVPQDAFLFSTTIRENITLGRENISEHDLSGAIKISQLVQDLDDFPNGLETEIGERGITLSGGQKQRVAIARAIITNPPVILLDDPLSAVDADTEDRIAKNLKTFLTEKTSIIVTNRVSTVRDADQILVVDQGEICERGTHDQLIKKGGTYTELFKREVLSRKLEEGS